MCRLSWNLGTSTSWNPLGLFRPVMRLLYLFYSPILLIYSCSTIQLSQLVSWDYPTRSLRLLHFVLTCALYSIATVFILEILYACCLLLHIFWITRTGTDFNPLNKKRVCFMQGLSAYRTVNTLKLGYTQDRAHTYNLTLRRFCAITVEMEKQQALRIMRVWL